MYTVGEQDEHDDVFPVIEIDDGTFWQAPGDQERRLYKLHQVGENETYLRDLATTGVYHPVPLHEAARNPSKRRLLTSDYEGVDGTKLYTQVYTDGVLPRPHPYVVYEFITLRTLAEICPPEVVVLAVNAATPCQELFIVDEDQRDAWADLHDELFDPEARSDSIVTRATGAPETGPLLHGLACGAHLCFSNGDAWNTLDWHGAGYSNEVERLEEFWGIRVREDWLDTEERLLSCEISPWYWDFVLGARIALTQAYGPRIEPGQWRDCIEETLRRRVDPGANKEGLEEFIAALRDLVGKILRYESRFRADGLLGPDEKVRTIAAWDLGRASKMARWGRGARYATRAEMYAALERTSASVQKAYGSWAEFSAAYIMGRCLHFDQEHFSSWYTSVLEAHRALVTEPESPWLTVPFTLPAVS